MDELCCPCCKTIAQTLREFFRKGDDDQFNQIWTTVVDKRNNPYTDPFIDLELLVRFKLKVYFSVVEHPSMNQEKISHRMQRLSNFLHEDGTSYSKFPELAPYFALPYITGNDHPIVADIQTDEWINTLERQWLQLLIAKTHHFHGFDEKKIERKLERHTQLKDKYIKLKEDHKMLLDLATRLVSSLEDSLRGETMCDLETFEFYNQEIKNLSDSLDENKNPAFQWEARSLKKSLSTESIDSKHSFE